MAGKKIDYKNFINIGVTKFNQIKVYLIISVFIVLAFLIGFVNSIFISALLVGLLYKIDTKFIAIPTLVLLGLIPILLITQVDWLAEEFATYVYYLLIITVAIEIKNSLTKGENKPREKLVYIKPEKPITQQKLLNTNKQQKPNETIKKLVSLISRIRLSKHFIFNSIVGLTSLIIPILIFNFRGLPYFRDIVTLPFFRNLSVNRLSLSIIEKGVFNQLTKIGFGPELLAESYFIIWFFLGSVLSYLYLNRINIKFNTGEESKKFLISNKALMFIISLVYVYNLFTFERFLMGQHLVLRGHFLFIPVIYYLIDFFDYFLNPHPHHSSKKQKEIGFKESFTARISHFIKNEESSNIYFDKLSKIGLLMIVLSLISTHHTIFAYYIIFISICFYFFSSFIHSKNFQIDWRILTRSILVITLVLLPSILIIFNRYYDSPQNQFLTQAESPSAQKLQIIEAFSPRTIDGENVTSTKLLGGASWDSRSFIETSKIQFELGFLDGLSYYYNPPLGFLFIILFSAIIIYLTNKADKNFTPIIFPILIFIPISLILSFGLTGSLSGINRLFYYLPSSLAFRESGKFYSLFLATTAILVAVFINYTSKNFKLFTQITTIVFLSSSLLLFAPLTSSIQYVDLFGGQEGKIFTHVNENCDKEKNVLLLPFNTYIDSSFGDIYISNPTRFGINCNIIYPQKSVVNNSANGTETITLSRTKLDDQIEDIFDDFIKNKDEDNGFRTLQAQIKSLKLHMLIVDEEKHPELKVLNNKLNRKHAPELVTDQLYLYQFDWV